MKRPSRFQGWKEDPEVHVFDFGYLRRLWPFVRPYRGAFLLCLVILVLSFGVEVAKPALFRTALDGPIASAVASGTVDRQALLRLGALYALMLVLGTGFGFSYGIVAAHNGQRVIRDVRKTLYTHLLSLSPRWFDKHPSGKLVTRVTSDVENLNELISTGVLQALFDLLKIAGLLVVLFVLDPGLALFTVLSTPLILVLSWLFKYFVRDSFRRVRSRLARQNAFTAEAIGGVRVTRVFGQQDAVHEHFAALNADTRSSWIQTVFHFAFFLSLVDLAVAWTQVGILWLGGGKVLAGTMTPGELLQFWMYFSLLAGPIKELGEKYNVLQSAFSSSERIFQILDQPPFPPPDPAAQESQRGPASVRFEDVVYGYDEALPVLHGVSFDARPGERIALVGPTGAGKTTVLALLSRLMDPQRGRVLLDGHDLRALDAQSLRRRVAVVPQDVFLFTGSVLDNVRLFDDTISEERVSKALGTVGAWDFVQRLNGGLHAKVEERGATLSQGERQLLSFARALAFDPDVLVLDEATASIDSESEARIQKALQVVLRGRTSLIVAHRLSTVRDADRILVLQKGRIVEQGEHRELLGRNGLYAKMVRQAAG
jgi:ATP-binding cassette subfamily B protein